MEELGNIETVQDAALDVSEHGWFIAVEVSPFSGYSGVYTQGIVEELDTMIRKLLDEKLEFLNDELERNYYVTRKDYTGMVYQG